MKESSGKPATAKSKPAPGPMAAPLRQALRERGLSARGASLLAGLNADAVRNVLSSRSRMPRSETVEALANALGVSVAAMLGREPLPPPPSLGPPPPAIVPPGMSRIPEIEFAPVRERLPHSADLLERTEGRVWFLPTDLLTDRNVRPGGLAIVRAPESRGDIRAGDWLLADTNDFIASPPGLWICWDTWGVILAKCAMARDGDAGALVRVEQGAETSELRLGEGIYLLGRVVARWSWT